MKVQFTILMLFAVFSQITAQLPANFAPIGTRWEYNYFAYGQSEGKYIYESVGDTLINAVPHRVVNLATKLKCDYPGCVFLTKSYPLFYTVRNDSLLALSQNGYIFLFNFNYKQGDSVTINYRNPSSPNAVVLRVADTTINGKNLKFWEIRQTCGPTKNRIDKVYESIGSIENGFYEFWDKCSSDPTSKQLCNVKMGNWTYDPYVCRYSVATQEIPFFNATISPNPVTEKLKIEFSIEKSIAQMDIVVYDLLGKVIHKQAFDNTNTFENIDVSRLPTGLYLLTVQSGRKKLWTQKFVKS